MVILTPFSPETIKKFIDSKTQVQIAGVDLTISNIYSISDGGSIDFSNEDRFIPEYIELEKDGNHWKLSPGAYIVRYNEIVSIPLNAVGIVLPRSSLLRIGATIYSALWDPGYIGRGISLMSTYSHIKIFENARIAQLMLIRTERHVKKGYKGKYQLEGIQG